MEKSYQKTFVFVCDMSKTDWNSEVSLCLSTKMLALPAYAMCWCRCSQ